MLKHTPLHARTSALMQGGAWRRWSGHLVASAYELGHEREYLAIRNAVAVLDVSPLHKYQIRGKDSAAYLNRLLTRDVRPLEVGQMLYTAWCDSRGKVRDDGTLARLEKNAYRLTAAEPNLSWLEDNAPGFAVTIDDVSDSLATLAVQGPNARALLRAVAGEDVDGLPYYHFTSVKIAGTPVMVSRTGYTGDLGYEVWIRTPLAKRVWDALIEAGRDYGLMPAGIWALDVARIEAGLIMLDVDYTPANRAMTEAQASSALELGLPVAWDKGPFVGRRALLAERERGPASKLVGLVIDHTAYAAAHTAIGLTTPYPFQAWRDQVPVHAQGRQVGYATSGVWSPTLKKYIALAHVDRALAAPGQTVEIELPVDRTRQRFGAVVSKRPFFNPARKKD